MGPITLILTRDDIADLVVSEVRRRASIPEGQVFANVAWLQEADNLTAIVTIGGDQEETTRASQAATKHVRI